MGSLLVCPEYSSLLYFLIFYCDSKQDICCTVGCYLLAEPSSNISDCLDSSGI